MNIGLIILTLVFLPKSTFASPEAVKSSKFRWEIETNFDGKTKKEIGENLNFLQIKHKERSPVNFEFEARDRLAQTSIQNM